MKPTIRYVLGALMAVALLGGCSEGQDTEEVEKQAEETVAEAEETVEAAGEAAKDKVEEAEKKVERAAAESMRLDEDVPKRAVAVLQPTKGNEVTGTVTFEPVDEGLEVNAKASGLSEGEHGYHIHLYGDCTAADGTSAGTHFNLEGSSLDPPEDIDRITGNLGNLSAGKNGKAEHDTVLEGASLTGPKSIVGRSVIVHAEANDPGKPPIGAAGARQACGVIGIAEPEGDGSSSGGDADGE